MAPDTTHDSPSPLDLAERLPARNKGSIALVLLVQMLNSFNDNFVKALLISLAFTVAPKTFLGDHMEELLVGIFSLPYVLFAPLAGWWSDRASKRTVIAWMQVAQLVCFGLLTVILAQKHPFWSLLLGLFGFFVLATQAAFLGPAKMGVMKELAGSRRLGGVSGLLQMTMMAGVLAGFWAGGWWYDAHHRHHGDEWQAALTPLIYVAVLAVGELIAALCVQRTPEHPEVHFEKSRLWEHFSQIKLVFEQRSIRLAALGIMFFWFVSNAIGLIMVTLAKEMHSGHGPREMGELALILGIGVVAGSLIAGAICKRKVELGILPLAGLGMMAGLFWAGFAPQGSHSMYGGLIFTGLAGGCFMVPLYAFVQDRADPATRARIIAGLNLLDCLAVVACAGFVFGLKALGLTGPQQLLALALPTLIATLITTRLLPVDFVRFICLSITRSIYKVRGIHAERVPATGGVLLLPNHVSYVDALVISVACPRPVRFVMWDSLYRLWWLNGFLRLFGTVPISPTRAKDAIRTVAEALKAGECVCLFPEGQLTRTGMVNEVMKGFELMVRQADVPVVPVYQDGLWGSIFSHEGAGVFKKLPKALRYPVTIFFGHAIPPKEAKADRVREAILSLGSEALCSRHPEATITDLNLMRLDEVLLDDPSRRFVDAATGAVIAAQVADPEMPKGEEDLQRGTRDGTLGRLLPGLAVHQTPEGLKISGLAPRNETAITLPGAKLDAMGFIVPGSPS